MTEKEIEKQIRKALGKPSNYVKVMSKIMLAPLKQSLDYKDIAERMFKSKIERFAEGYYKEKKWK